MEKKDLAVFKKDLKRAEKRMGDKARWLLDFAYKDLSRLTKKDVSDLSFEINAFAMGEKDAKTWPEKGIMDDPEMVYSMYSSLLGAVGDGMLINSFQGELSKRFEQARQGRWWEYTFPAETRRFTVFKDVHPPGVHYAQNSGSGFGLLDRLMIRATRLIERERDRFGICKNRRCEKMFVAERKNRAKYCQPKCAAYVRVNKKRGKL